MLPIVLITVGGIIFGAAVIFSKIEQRHRDNATHEVGHYQRARA